MDRHTDSNGDARVTREDLVALLNDDLAREYQAIISYVVYSQVLQGAQYMNIAAELEKHASEELSHALLLAGQIDYLGGMPETKPKPVRTSAKAEDMLRFDLEAETETIHHYRQAITHEEFICRICGHDVGGPDRLHPGHSRRAGSDQHDRGQAGDGLRTDREHV